MDRCLHAWLPRNSILVRLSGRIRRLRTIANAFTRQILKVQEQKKSFPQLIVVRDASERIVLERVPTKRARSELTIQSLRETTLWLETCLLRSHLLFPDVD